MAMKTTLTISKNSSNYIDDGLYIGTSIDAVTMAMTQVDNYKD